MLDFGLAKLKEAERRRDGRRPDPRADGVGRIVGTVAYMSPEQAEGTEVDQRSDIFSLGIMLYELATGERPFKGDTSLSVLSAVVKDTPRPVTEVNPGVPSAVARVIKTCLQKDPERRYQSAKDVRNELRTIKEELASGELAAPAIALALELDDHDGWASLPPEQDWRSSPWDMGLRTVASGAAVRAGLWR